MANYATLKAGIVAAIKENGNNEITGNLLQQQLLAMVNSLGVGYQYAGIATQATNPGTPDQNVFYLASTAGTYTNFGGLVLADGEIAILKWNGAWSKDSTGAATQESVNQLGQKINNVRDNNAYATNFTAAATATKVLADDNCPNLDYSKNLRLLIKFINGNTADDVSLTILNGTYPFYYRGARASATNCWEAGDILDCRFDMGTNRWYSEPWSGVGTKREIEELQNEVAGVLKESDLGYIIASDNIANPANVSNHIISSTGGIEDTSGDWQIVSIPVTPGQIITFGGFYLGRTGYYAFYNGNTKISYSVFNDPNGTTSPVTVTVPDGAAVLHIDIKTGQSPDNPYQYLQANIGSSLKSYDEFKKEIKTIKGYGLYGSGRGSDLSTLIQDLPVSDGTGIASGYAYIDSSDRCVKVKE